MKTLMVVAALLMGTSYASACTDARQMVLNRKAGALFNEMNRVGTPAAGRAYMKAMHERKVCINEQVSGFGGHGNTTSLSEADYAVAARAYPLAVDPIPPKITFLSEVQAALYECKLVSDVTTLPMEGFEVELSSKDGAKYNCKIGSQIK